MAQISEIDLVGIDYPGQVFTDNFIYRLNRKPAELTSYPYLVVCKRIEEISTSNTDILMVEDFKKIEAVLKKRVKKKLGLEVTVFPARKKDGPTTGKWFNHIGTCTNFAN